jgi:hypothetical protein
MNFEGALATEIYKTEMPLAERKAALNHRTKHMRAPETQAAITVINTVLSAVLGIFLR